MNAFIFLPIWCGIVYFISQKGKFHKMENIDDSIGMREPIWFAFLAFFPIFFLAAIAEPCADTVAYLFRFNNTPALFSYVDFSDNGWGFSLFTVIIKKIFGNNEIVFRIAIALVHTIPIVLIFRKYSDNYVASLFIFVSSATYLSWMMNGLRQFMAVTIVMLSIPLILKKKYVGVCLLILLATAFHQTAIIMLPIVFVAQGKVFNKSTLFFILVSIIAMMLFGSNSELFSAAVSDTDYALGYESIKENDDGINPMRVIVNAVPVILAIFSKEKLKQQDDRITNICINMSIITLGVSLVAMVTSGIYVGRLIIYTQLFGFIILPKLITSTFNKRSQPIVYAVMILMYLIYYKQELGNYFYYDIDVFGGLR